MTLKSKRKKLLLVFTGVLLFLLTLRNLCVQHSFKKILSELEGYELYASAITEYEKLNAVREFVYQNSVFAAGKDVWEDSTFGKDVFALTKRARLVRLFNLRENIRGGGIATCSQYSLPCFTSVWGTGPTN